MARSVAVRCDPALMQLDQLLDERQTYAETTARATPLSFALGKQLKEIRHLLDRNADAAVGDRYHDLGPALLGRKLNVARGLGVFRGVVEQIGKHLREAREIAIENQRLGRQQHLKLVLALVDQ